MNAGIKKFSSLTLILAFLVSSSFTNVLALEEQVQINLTVVSNDTNAPTTPTDLSATAVSTSQINLSWTASTDDTAVTAYRVFRDSVFVATSTATTYSDTGLSPSTTYTYTVSAVDASFNESAQSASAQATTLSVSTGGGGGTTSGSSLRITNVLISALQNDAVITWQTTRYAISNIFWGETQQYELGQSAGAFYLTSHQIVIPNLQSGTQYFFRITARDSDGREVQFEGSFVSTGIAEGIENPRNFRAIAGDSEIFLSWNNPISSDFEEVRILRSERFFPFDPYDGEVIYEGRGQSFVDTQVEVGKRYYYAIFAKNSDGQYSSGAVDDARIVPAGEIVEPPKDIFDELPKAPFVHPVIQALSILDFDFIQEGKKQSVFQEKTIVIDGTKNLTVSLDYDKVPEVLKAILITLTDPEDSQKVFTFILRVSEDKTRYIATIGPLGKSGNYGVSISIVDFKNQGLKKIEGDLLATTGSLPFDQREGFVYWLLQEMRRNFLWIILLVIVYILWRQWRRREMEKRKALRKMKGDREKTE